MDSMPLQVLTAAVMERDAILDRQKMRVVTLVDAHDHQGTEPLAIRSQAAVDAIRPDIYPAIIVQTTMLPALVLRPPYLLQTRYRAG